MKKQNITEGEWESGNPHKKEVWTSEDRFVAKFDRVRYANIACMAVNNTFGKGIDPEIVDEMIDALKEVQRRFYDDYKFDSSPKGMAVGKVKETLQKAGVKL